MTKRITKRIKQIPLPPANLVIGWTNAAAIRSHIDHFRIPAETGTVIRIRGDQGIAFIRCLQKNLVDEAMNHIKDLNASGQTVDYSMRYNIPGCQKRLRAKGRIQDVKLFYVMNEVNHMRITVIFEIQDLEKDLIL